MVARISIRGRPDAGDLGTLIACSRRLVWLAASRRLEAVGESMLVWQALNRLRCAGPMAQCELAVQVGQHPAGISRLLDGLEREGVVRRTRSPEDRRKVRVELTAKARRRLAVIDPQVALAASEVLTPLSEPERQTLRELLTKLLDAHGSAPRRR